ncbi:hypothetical protein SKAU_G00061260 [Synaphobranchus kaupii]|uniref:Integrase catalytic domain-containing protein n=1 Tax=Synaphobranchus kaupii TaxID=118154 RepID=A0A9Q1G5S4_SYNKA|nr:hypothetical protein SKAU_G00061260 [Synaphobranchus kaupii]
MDYFTKWPEAYAIPDQETESVVEALVQGMFSRFGTPSELQGRNFESRVFAAMCSRLEIRKTRTTPLHPQSDGFVKRFMRTLGAQLALTTAQDQNVPAGVEYACRLQDRLEVAHSFARRQLEQAGIRQKRGYDVHTKGREFHAGDLVWVYGPKRVKGRSPKLDSKWIGPCYVLSSVGEVVYRVRLAPRGRTVVLHQDRMAPYKGSGQPAFTLSPLRARRGSPHRSPGNTPPMVEHRPEESDAGEGEEPPVRQNTFRGEQVTPHGAIVPRHVPYVPTPVPQVDTGARRSQRT